MNMNYRNTEYSYHEWITFDGNQATGYHCDDKELLKGINTTSFGATTKAEMHSKIDDYIDNKAEHLEWQAQYNRAEAEYYEKYGTVNEF